MCLRNCPAPTQFIPVVQPNKITGPAKNRLDPIFIRVVSASTPSKSAKTQSSTTSLHAWLCTIPTEQVQAGPQKQNRFAHRQRQHRYFGLSCLHGLSQQIDEWRGDEREAVGSQARGVDALLPGLRGRSFLLCVIISDAIYIQGIRIHYLGFSKYRSWHTQPGRPSCCTQTTPGAEPC